LNLFKSLRSPLRGIAVDVVRVGSVQGV
jgi:hypothetical protein